MSVKSFETVIDQEFGMIAELVRAHAHERPRHPALIDDRVSIDFGPLDQRMDRIATSLQRDQVHSGEAIAICAAASVDYAVVFLGALRAGVAVAPLSPSSTPESLVTMLADCGAKFLFLDEHVAATLATVALPSGLQLVRLDSAPGVRSLDAWLAPAGSVPVPVTLAPDAAFNIIGEVVGRSAAMMKGYFNQPGKTAEAQWYDGEGNRFIRTGDVGRFDADGFLTLMDRRKDMIIPGGFDIYPSDLENALFQHPAVGDAAVVGVPSKEWGETPIAFVVLRPDATASAEELKQWTNSRLGKTQRVTAVELVTELPRSAIGKVLKRELRDKYSQAAPMLA